MVNSSQSPDPLLTFEEVAEVDQALLTTKDKFLVRVALYSLRSLKQIALETDRPIEQITEQQLVEWVKQDESSHQAIGGDRTFEQFFIQIVLSSLKPLRQVAADTQVAIEDLTIPQVISWFEQKAKKEIEQGQIG
jgi:hypothetical protein